MKHQYHPGYIQGFEKLRGIELLSAIVKLYEIEWLSVSISPENDSHIPSTGCSKLGYLLMQTSVRTEHPISIDIDEEHLYTAIDKAFIKHVLYEAFQKYEWKNSQADG